MNEISVYWGNLIWAIDANGILAPIGKLSENDPRWIQYENIQGESSDLYKEEHAQARVRTILHRQILDLVFNGAELYRFDNPHCILTHGGIASGKTSAIEHFLSDEEKKRRYLHLDFDKMKKQLPEFVFMKERGIKSAASYTQSESSKLAGKAFKKAINLKLNVIYEGSLAESATIDQRIRQMKRKGYSITIVSTYVTEEIGQTRALSRFNAGGRFVPSDVVSETYKKCPKSLVELKPLVDKILLIDNNLEGQPSRPILFIDNGKVEMLNQELYQKYFQATGTIGKLI